MWDQVARFYNAQTLLERPSLRAAVAISGVGQQDRLLDVGTGTGAVLTTLAAAGRLPRLATGLDLSKQMLKHAQEAWKGHLIRADATRLPFDDGSFDVVVTAYLLHLLDEPARRQVLTESRRVLQMGGGRLITVTPSYGSGSAASVLSRSIERVAKRSSSVLVGLRPFDPSDELLAAGFEVIQTRSVRLGYPSLCVAATRSA